MTPTELKTEALREIGILEKTETAPAEEMNIATNRYELLHAMLLKDGLATWAYTENIPDRYAMPVVWMLANMLTSVFAVPMDRKQELLSLGALHSPQPSLGERQLRRMVSSAYVSQPVQSDYY